MKYFILLLIFILCSIGVFAGVPTIENLTLTSTLGTNTTSENLTCNYNLNDTATTSVVAWYKNNTPIMVLYLPFEGNSTNALLDYSGNENNVTNINSTFWNLSGGYRGTGSFRFNGTAAESYLKIKNSSSLSNTRDRGTITLWVYPQKFGVQQMLIKDNVSEVGSAWRTGIDLSIESTGAITFYPKLDPLQGWKNKNTGSTILKPKNWTFVVVTWDFNLYNSSIYINGVETAYSTRGVNSTNWLKIASEDTLFIGKDPDGGKLLNGTMDEIRFYNYILSTEQIKALYNNRTDLIVSNETRINDTWNCNVTPFSSITVGQTYTSNNITIISPTTNVCSVTGRILFVTNTVCDIFTVNSNSEAVFTYPYTLKTNRINFPSGTTNATIFFDRNSIFK